MSAIGLLTWTQTSAQIYIGSGNGLFIKSGSTFIADSLVLTPTADLSLTNNTFTQSNTPAQGIGGSGISQLYTWSSPFTFQGTAGLFYDPAQLNGNTAATLQLAYRNTTTGDWLPASGSTVNTSTSYVSNVFTTPTQLSAFTAASAGVVLPISLSSFTARAEDRKVRLDFDINLHGENAICNIERSADGKHFTLQQQLNLLAGQHAYNTYDSKPLQGLNHYREVSMIRTVFMADAAATELSFFPVPATDLLQINLLEAPAPGSYLQLSSSDGRMLLKKDVTDQTMSINVAGYPSGVYTLSFYNGTRLSHFKISKH
jgi:hypothetical protein